MFVVDLYHQHVNFHDEEMFIFLYFEIHAVANILAIPHKSALYTVKHQKKLVDVCIEKSCFCKAHSLMLICHSLKQVSKVKVL